MSVLDTAEYRRLALIAAGVDPSMIPCILDTATWRRLMLAALYDLSQGGGGGAGYITGSVQFYADLPVTVGTPAVNTAYLVRENSGVWFINRKPAGIYVRLFNLGNLNDWDYAGAFPEVNDAQYFRIYDSADPTREVAFDVSGVTTGTTRTLTVPNASGTLVLGNDSRIANIAANSITTAQGANSGGAGGTITMRGGITGSEGAGGNAGSINLRGSDDRGDGVFNGGSIDLSGVSGNGGNITSTGNNENAGGSLNMSGSGQGAGGSINTSDLGGSIVTASEGGTINTSSGGGMINTSSLGGSINTSNSGGAINTSGGEDSSGGSINTSGSQNHNGGSIDTSGGETEAGGSINTSDGGGSINTRGTGSIGFGESGARTTLTGTATEDRAISLPNAGGTLALTTDIPSTFAASAITSGTFDNARVNFAAPPAIGSTTRNSGAFTTLSAAPTSGSALTLTGGTVTASAPLIDASQTWNNAAVTFTGLAATITNTASNAASLVSRFTVGSTNVFEVDARGFTTFRKVATTTDFVDIFTVRRGTTKVFGVRDDGSTQAEGFSCGAGGNGASSMNSDGYSVRSSGSFRISSDSAAFSPDVFLRRDAAGVFAQYNGTNTQESRLYGTFTSSTNYQRMTVKSVKQTLSALSGASATTTGTFIPDGAVVVGVTTRVATALTGAAGYTIGDGTDADRWGDITGTAIGTTSDNRDWTAGTIECFTAGGNITLTAKTSNFTAGAIEICVFYLAGEAD